jgi:hypothetical protein
LRKAGTLQLHRLQLYEIFNVRLHLCMKSTAWAVDS